MTALPAGLTAGTWNVDPLHSEFAFVARHAGVSKVRGGFDVIGGTLEVGDSLATSTVSAQAEAASISTGNEQRDGHLKTGDFLLAEEHPTVSFASAAIENVQGAEFDLRGQLTMRGVSQEVVFAAEFNGAAEDPNGNTVAGFSATASVNRKDFGMSFDAVLKGGELLVSDKVSISIEIEAVRA